MTTNGPESAATGRLGACAGRDGRHCSLFVWWLLLLAGALLACAGPATNATPPALPTPVNRLAAVPPDLVA